MDKDDKDWEEKANHFNEVLKLMGMINRETNEFRPLATLLRKQYLAFIDAGFTEEEAFKLLLATTGGLIGGVHNG